MSKNARRRSRPADEENTLCTVNVCRGGDCGSRTKHPDTDHRAQLRLITEKLENRAVVTVTKCLDACERSNVMVVTPSDSAREEGAEQVWLGEMNDQTVTTELISWVQAGGPGHGEMPLEIELTSFTPSRRMRHALDD